MVIAIRTHACSREGAEGALWACAKCPSLYWKVFTQVRAYLMLGVSSHSNTHQLTMALTTCRQWLWGYSLLLCTWNCLPQYKVRREASQLTTWHMKPAGEKRHTSKTARRHRADPSFPAATPRPPPPSYANRPSSTQRSPCSPLSS